MSSASAIQAQPAAASSSPSPMDLIEAELAAMPRRIPSAHSAGSASSAGVSMSGLQVAVAPGQLMVRPEAIQQARARIAVKEEDAIRSLENPSPELAALVASRQRRQASRVARERVALAVARDEQAAAAAGLPLADELDEDGWAPGEEGGEEQEESAAEDEEEDEYEDPNELQDMEDDLGREADAAELNSHAQASGYFDAVPAARAEFAAGAAARIAARDALAGAGAGAGAGARGAAPGVPMTLDDVAKAMTASDIKPEDGQAWGVLGQELRTAVASIEKLASTTVKNALGVTKVAVFAERVKPYAKNGSKERVVQLPDSVSEAGVKEKALIGDVIASRLTVRISRVLKEMDMIEADFYKLAVANHVSRHTLRKFIAQKKQRDQEAAQREAYRMRVVQMRMQDNAGYQNRQLRQADKRQKVGTAEGAKQDRFADLS